MAENKPQIQYHRPDYWLLGLALILLSLGLMTLLSASGIVAERIYSDPLYFFKRQLLFAAAGILAMTAVALLPRPILYKLQYPALLLALVLLLLTLTPLAAKVKGARRWLSFGPFGIQPMEFAKIALVMYLAYFMSTKQAMIKTFSRGVIPPFAVTALFCLLLLMQPDFGGAAVLSLLLFFMCLAGGTRVIYLAISAAFFCCGAYLLVMHEAYRFRRILAFLDPFKVARDEGYQLVQSLYALGSGGLWGAGLGDSKQKLFFLPDAHTDFIMAIAGEELGFVGMTLIFFLLGLFFWRAMRVAFLQEDLRDRLTAFGLTLILGLSMILNMAVVMGVAPPKGLPMPFFSYGGSSLLATFICVGVLLNISRTARTGS
ncbi:putative lipid II flippase FtsW [Desulfovibrio sp. OttesenSCG-928-O18]|nr:putative lipid II flippase FtsW [Desulfovibrio sp. OttesenSCG-928-O18]